MIVYSVQLSLPSEIAPEWLEWMQTVHIPEVIAVGIFTKYKIYRMLSPLEENSTGYRIEYFCESLEQYELYREKFAPALQADHTEKFGKYVKAGRSIMEEL